MEYGIKCEICNKLADHDSISQFKLLFSVVDICHNCAKTVNFKKLQSFYQSKEYEQDVLDSELMISELEHDNFISESDHYWNANVSYLSQRVHRLLSRLQ